MHQFIKTRNISIPRTTQIPEDHLAYSLITLMDTFPFLQPVTHTSTTPTHSIYGEARFAIVSLSETLSGVCGPVRPELRQKYIGSLRKQLAHTGTFYLEKPRMQQALYRSCKVVQAKQLYRTTPIHKRSSTYLRNSPQIRRKTVPTHTLSQPKSARLRRPMPFPHHATKRSKASPHTSYHSTLLSHTSRRGPITKTLSQSKSRRLRIPMPLPHHATKRSKTSPHISYHSTLLSPYITQGTYHQNTCYSHDTQR